MAELGDALFDALKTIATIGGPGAPRLYRNRLPQPYTLPAVTMTRVDTVFEYAHDGDSTLVHPRWQISCWAETNAAAELLAGTVQTTLDAWTHAQVASVLPQNKYDLTDPDTRVHQVALDVIIWWKTI